LARSAVAGLLTGLSLGGAVARLLELEKHNGRVWLLTAVKNPQRSHVSALAQFLGAVFEYRE